MNKSLAAVVLALGTLFFCADASFAGPVHHHHHHRHHHRHHIKH